MKLEFKTKGSKFLLLIVCVGSAALTVYSNVDFIQRQRTRSVFAAIGKANDHRKQKGETLDAYAAYIAELRTIDTDYTIKGLKPAFASYVQGLEEQLTFAKTGDDPAAANAQVRKAHAELVELARQND